MNINLQKFDLSQIKLVCSFTLLILLIFEISLAEPGLTHFFAAKALDSSTEESSQLSLSFNEELEDKSANLQVLSLDLVDCVTAGFALVDVSYLNYYAHSLNHSRSPPVS